MEEFLLILDDNFERFEKFFANSRGYDFKTYQDKIGIAIAGAKKMSPIWKLSKMGSSMTPIVLSSIGAVLLFKSYEEASAIMTGMVYFLVFLIFTALDYIREEKFSKEIIKEENSRVVDVLKKLMPYYLMSQEKELSKDIMEKFGKSIKNDEIIESLWQLMSSNLKAL